jgi:hypothetical protein
MKLALGMRLQRHHPGDAPSDVIARSNPVQIHPPCWHYPTGAK